MPKKAPYSRTGIAPTWFFGSRTIEVLSKHLATTQISSGLSSDSEPTVITAGSDSNAKSIRELGRYRNFLRLKAMGISPHYRGRVEPSDVVQQTLLEAHLKLGQFRGKSEAQMAKWLSKMLSNNIADAVRALRRQKRDIARERPIQNGGRSSLQAAEWIASDQTSPSLGAFKAEQLVQLADAIDQLPTSQQEVIALHHFQGLSLAEVASHVQRSPSAVAGLLYRGLKSLRKMLN